MNFSIGTRRKTNNSYLSRNDGYNLCSFPLCLLCHRSTVATIGNFGFMFFQCEAIFCKVSTALRETGVNGGFGWRRGCTFLKGHGRRHHCCLLCYMIGNDVVLRKMHVSSHPKRSELGLLGKGDWGQASFNRNVQRVNAHHWVRASWLMICGAAFG